MCGGGGTRGVRSFFAREKKRVYPLFHLLKFSEELFRVSEQFDDCGGVGKVLLAHDVSHEGISSDKPRKLVMLF